MAALPNIDLLRGACLANGIPIDGSYDELRLKLGAVLVDKMLGSSPPPSTFPPPPSSAANNGKKRACDQDAPKQKKPRKPSNWHAFLREEKHKIHEGMPTLKGHALISEAARRWKLHKAALAGSSPPMLTDGGSSSAAESDNASDGSVEGLTAELLTHSNPAEINANLQLAGLPIDDDPEVNASRLAEQMVVEL